MRGGDEIFLPSWGAVPYVFSLAHERSTNAMSLANILWAVVVILVILWLLGWLVGHIGGGLIHILLVIAVIVLVYNLLVGMRRGV